MILFSGVAGFVLIDDSQDLLHAIRETAGTDPGAPGWGVVELEIRHIVRVRVPCDTDRHLHQIDVVFRRPRRELAVPGLLETRTPKVPVGVDLKRLDESEGREQV